MQDMCRNLGGAGLSGPAQKAVSQIGAAPEVGTVGQPAYGFSRACVTGLVSAICGSAKVPVML